MLGFMKNDSKGSSSLEYHSTDDEQSNFLTKRSDTGDQDQTPLGKKKKKKKKKKTEGFEEIIFLLADK